MKKTSICILHRCINQFDTFKVVIKRIIRPRLKFQAVLRGDLFSIVSFKVSHLVDLLDSALTQLRQKFMCTVEISKSFG